VSIPDPYKVLQVDPEAEDEVIVAAYRRLARKYHPDVSPGPESVQRMVRINQAWELLKDPVRRAAVDRARARAALTAARSAAAGPHPRSPAQPTTPEARRAGTGSGPSPAPTTRPGPAPTWPMPGMRDPSDDETGRPRPDRVSPDWTSGRSSAGGTYDPATMGAPQGDGAAGPPPGNPIGSVLAFGRYTGWSLGEIARADLEYLEWLDRMPIGRAYQAEIDALLRGSGRRTVARTPLTERRGLFRRR
jgi:curved DNA-binding protein CbpA